MVRVDEAKKIFRLFSLPFVVFFLLQSINSICVSLFFEQTYGLNYREPFPGADILAQLLTVLPLVFLLPNLLLAPLALYYTFKARLYGERLEFMLYTFIGPLYIIMMVWAISSGIYH